MTLTEKKTLAQYYIIKAKETMAEAELLYENQFYNATVSRLYYSCFYAVNSLLVLNGIGAKKHSGVIQMFGLHFVSTGMISAASAKIYTSLFELRQDADYESYFDMDEGDTLALFAPAKTLIAEIEQILSTK